MLQTLKRFRPLFGAPRSLVLPSMVPERDEEAPRNLPPAVVSTLYRTESPPLGGGGLDKHLSASTPKVHSVGSVPSLWRRLPRLCSPLLKSGKSSSPLRQHSCLEFGPVNSHAVLRTRPEYMPKVPTTPFRDQEDDANFILPSTLRITWNELSHSDIPKQLFVCYGGQQKGKAVSKQRFPHWLVDAIRMAYQARGLPCPLGVRAHSTKAVAALAAFANGASLTDICRATGWATPNTFRQVLQVFTQFFKERRCIRLRRKQLVSRSRTALFIPGCPGQLCKICTPNFIGLFSKLSEVFGLPSATPSVVHLTQHLRSLHQGTRVTIRNRDVIKEKTFLALTKWMVSKGGGDVLEQTWVLQMAVYFLAACLFLHYVSVAYRFFVRIQHNALQNVLRQGKW
ncbi:hypothetical protein H4Q32_024231 [Labeo rohita]|uniref:Uncharacterized protein n=1 Tax=Labeo rohita TaxID=84645 RepID=A0ABQ8LYB8_LABRO|nr:hypothetical protein H4Q32_024231 [Labeo rohita]